ncbi:MAG: C-terminal binding protein [Ruminococcaceae bacterium]|nr:C-terminal binding protein [Oscillospiraceae bacterium]
MKAYMVDAHMMKSYDFSVEKGIMEPAGVEYLMSDCQSEDDIIAKCADADALTVVYCHVGEKTMKALKNLKVIVRYGIGYDNFDVDAATAAGVKVCNIPHYSVPEVATHTTAMILASTRHLPFYDRSVHAAQWRSDKFAQLETRRPDSQWVGLVGFGEIGRAVAGQLLAIGYHVMAYDPYLEDAAFEKRGVKRVQLDELLAKSDIISAHTPLNAETRHLLNAAAFAAMKDGVVVVNTARGGVVEEPALVAAVKSGKVAAAALDVMENEPMTNPDNPILALENVILTPHVAYRSRESTHALQLGVAEAVVQVLGGKVPGNVVNKAALGL